MRIVVIAAKLPHCECTDVKLTDVGNLGEGSALKAFYCSDNPTVANTGLILFCHTAFCILLKLKTLARSLGKEGRGGSQFQQKNIFQTLAQNLDLIQGWIDVLPTNKGALVKPNSAQTLSTLKVLGEKQIYDWRLTRNLLFEEKKTF